MVAGVFSLFFRRVSQTYSRCSILLGMSWAWRNGWQPAAVLAALRRALVLTGGRRQNGATALAR
jgi:hypothetical protein